VVDLLKNYPISVELGSHTDSRSSAKYNNELSLKRADAAVKYLIEKGVEASRLTYKGYGESMLINKCADGADCSESEHQANRRTEFKITSVNSGVSNMHKFDSGIYKAGEKLPFLQFDKEFFKGCLEK
jgi:outer membrane protein OmpA-like peptidoglycan-associated protein